MQILEILTLTAYNLIEVATKSPRHRGLLVSKQDLGKFITQAIDKKEQLYRSIYTYDNEAEEYTNAHNGLAKYLGVRGIDNVIIDIDKGGNTDEYTLKKARDIVQQLLLVHEAPQGSFQCFFSGTGYHIALTNQLFRFTPSDVLPYTVKQTMKNLFGKHIDSMIYMRTGLYRVAHTINNKEGLYKVPLTYKEFMNLEPGDIKRLALDPRASFPYETMVADGELEAYVAEETALSVKEFTNVTEPNKVAPCIQKLYRLGPVEGKRHNTIMRIASHYRRNGINSEACKVAMLHWNNGVLEENAVISKVEDVYNKGYQWGEIDGKQKIPSFKKDYKTRTNPIILHSISTIYFKEQDWCDAYKLTDRKQIKKLRDEGKTNEEILEYYKKEI